MNPIVLSIALALLWIPTIIAAGNPPPAPTAAEIVEKLAPAETRTRSMRNLQPVERLIDLNIQFAFDSDKLLPPGREMLEQLVIAMNAPRLATAEFSIEGHTDAKGTATYNQKLSERRANAVVAYLIDRGISPQRLTSMGKGFSELLDPANPQGPENRRVRIRDKL